MSAEKEQIKKILASDPALRPLVEQLPFPENQEDRNLYFDLIRTIAFQQLSGKAAQTIFNRFLDLFENQWPHPEKLVEMDSAPLRGAGLSQQKSDYVRNIAAFFLEQNLLERNWHDMDDESILHTLTRIKGVGVWTAEMILMFTLNRPDIFPADDLGIQTAISRLYGIAETGKERKNQMIAIAENWRPYRTYASKFLWKYLDSGMAPAK